MFCSIVPTNWNCPAALRHCYTGTICCTKQNLATRFKYLAEGVKRGGNGLAARCMLTLKGVTWRVALALNHLLREAEVEDKILRSRQGWRYVISGKLEELGCSSLPLTTETWLLSGLWGWTCSETVWMAEASAVAAREAERGEKRRDESKGQEETRGERRKTQFNRA